MNGGVRVTSFSLNHAGATSNAWRLDTLDIEHEFVVISEPATTLAITDIRHTGGTVELLPTPYTSTDELRRMIDMYVGKWSSVPGFVANLTIELFYKQTAA